MSRMPIDSGTATHRIPAYILPDNTAANHVALAISTTSASTAALTAGMYRLSTDVDCFVVQAATALTTHMPFTTANSGESFYVNAGGVVSAITATGTGTLTLTKMP